MSRGRERRAERYVTNVLVSFAATYRATLEFFAKREATMAEFHPEPFRHWAHGDRHFNLVSTDTRRVIRFEPSRLVVRAEGHTTMKPYDELVAITTRVFEEFKARDLFGATYTLLRVREQPTRQDARSTFAAMYLSDAARNLMPMDGNTDYGVTFARDWMASTEFVEMRPALAPLRIKVDISAGPTDYHELGERHCEFTREAPDEMYRTEHVAPDFGIMAFIRVTLARHRAKEGVGAPYLWRFHEWARSEAEAQWAKIEESIR
jgi:hypothetical protein